jgi:zinc protease
MKTTHFSAWALTLLFIFVVGTSEGQQIYNPKSPVPFDPAYKTGVLENGIRYILRGNFSYKKAYFYAFYNIGAIQEEQNEYGLAHLLEHLCFNDKSNYIDYFKANGLNMGEDINGNTQLGCTRYKVLNVPIQNEGLVDTTLFFLRDLSFKLNIKPEDIERERKVVLEEWRLKQVASARMSEITEKLALKGSKYSRPRVGDTTVISHCTINNVKDFFNKWYRPDHLTVIIIGDFDVNKMEAKVKQYFSPIPKAEGKSPRITYPLPDNKEPIINIVADPEATSGNIEIYYKHNNPIVYNQQQLRTDYLDYLIYRMFQNRLDKITDSSNPPFTNVSALYDNSYFQNTDYNEYFIEITANKDIKIALRTILTENERIIKYGFTKAELQNAKNVVAKDYGPTQKEFNFPYEEYYFQCYYYILKGKTIPSFNFRRNFVNAVFPTIALDEVNNRFKAYTSKIQPVISIACPSKEKANIPTVADVKNILASIPSQKIEPYISNVTTGKLFDKKVKPGVVTKETTNSELGTTEWILSNGMRVIIKPTDFKVDEVQFKGLSKDTLKIKDEYKPTAVYGGRSLKNMGVDKFSSNELKQLLAGKNVSVEPVLSGLMSGISGNTSVKDFETALQLINLYYSNQRWDENVLTKEVQSAKSYRIENSSLAAFNDTIQKYWTVDKKSQVSYNLDDITLEKLKKIHKYVFKNPASFTFIFSGSLKPEKAKSLIEKYLGSLVAVKDSINKYEVIDSIKAKKQSKEKNVWWKTGRRSCIFSHPMQTPSASVYICYQGEITENRINSIYKEIAMRLLVKQCEITIRGKYGASYWVRLFNRLESSDSWQGHVYFQTDPKIVEEMKVVVMEEARKFMEGDLDEKEFNSLKNNIVNKRSEELKSNRWWVNTVLPEYYLHNKSIVLTYIEDAKSITLEGLKTFVRNIYAQGNFIDVVMKPE